MTQTCKCSVKFMNKVQFGWKFLKDLKIIKFNLSESLHHIHLNLLSQSYGRKEYYNYDCYKKYF